jgi:SP family galactose:H+ symporter-like MFS transporter
VAADAGAAGPADPAQALSPDAPEGGRITKWLVGIAAVVMLAGLLFGYDQGIIAGALAGIEDDFHPSTFVIEVITSWVTLGALAGALVAGRWRTSSGAGAP